MSVDVFGFLYSAAIAVGGLYGYLSKGSIPSLIAGLIFGSILAYGAWRVTKTPPDYTVQLIVASVLASLMGYRFYNSGKTMPAVVCCLSLIMMLQIAIRASGLLRRKK